jgi:SAM-dependent methyltransferase
MPCDQEEQDRLAIQHQVFLHVLKGNLTTTIVTPNTRRILDLGTGPGDWAVAMAKQYPHAEVVGVDIAVWDLETTEGDSGGGRVTWELDDLDVWSIEAGVDDHGMLENYDPVQDPTHRGPVEQPVRLRSKESQLRLKSLLQQRQPETNLQTPPEFDGHEFSDLSILEPEEQPGWNFSQPFDLIHLRNMKGSFSYWEEVYAEIYKHLRPGGHVEVADYEVLPPEILIQKPDGNTDENQRPPGSGTKEPPLPAVRKLYKAMMEASFISGRPLGTFYMHRTFLEEAGFKDIRTTQVNVPVGQWPKDEEQKQVGKMFLVVLMESFEPHLLRLATKYGDSEKRWTAEEVRALTEQAKKEILELSEMGAKEQDKGWCATFKWITGRKPFYENC